MRVVVTGSIETLVGVSHQTSPTPVTTAGVTFATVELPSDPAVAPTTAETLDFSVAGKKYVARAVDAISATELQALIFDTVSKEMTYVKLNFFSKVLTIRDMYVAPSLFIESGLFTGTSEGYIVGRVSTFDTEHTYANEIGFILSFDNQRNCFEVSETEVT